jgi:hypothetical protein
MYTPWTIDTYSTFDLEGHEDQEIYNYNEENGTSYTYDDFNWSYDHKGLVKQLANNWLDLTKFNILDDVILAITPDGEPWSPREYNFTTDDQNINFLVDYNKLVAYIEANREHYNQNKISDSSGFWWLGDKDQTMLHYYLATKSANDYTENDYISDQYDLLQGNGQLYELVSFELIEKQPEPTTIN